VLPARVTPAFRFLGKNFPLFSNRKASVFLFRLRHSKREPPRGTFHKAGFTYRKKQKEYGGLFVLLFTRLAWQGIVCYTFSVYYRAAMSLPCVKGGGSRKRDGGIVKNKIIPKNNPSVTFGDSSLYTRDPFLCSSMPCQFS